MRTDTGSEDGLSLVEILVAFVVIAIVLTALASTAIASLQSLTRSERVTGATHVGNEVLEELSGVPFELLGLYESESAATFPTSPQFEGEDLVIYPDPGIRDDRVPLPERSLFQDGTRYEVTIAIVWDRRDDAIDSYKRMIVDVSWNLRGDELSTRVERLIAPAPQGQQIEVSVAPEVISLTGVEEGTNQEAFEVTATAVEPQSAVVVRWIARDGTERVTGLNPNVEGTVWTVSFGSDTKPFSNGGTLFEVTATSLDGTRETTTIGRATFLHTLALPADRLTAVPSPLVVHPTDGWCSGLTINADLIGGILSDPVTLDFDPADDTSVLEAMNPDIGLVDGARYVAEFAPTDLPAPSSNQTYLTMELVTNRTADATSLATLIQVPVQHLAADAEGVVEPCSTS